MNRQYAGLLFLLMGGIASMEGAGIGLGVSPPQVGLKDGFGRFVVFNPGELPLSFTIETEGNVHVKPAQGVIQSLQAAQVMVSGDAKGLALIEAVIANQSRPVALPSVEVQIEPEEHPAKFQEWITIGTIAASFIALGALVLFRKYHT